VVLMAILEYIINIKKLSIFRRVSLLINVKITHKNSIIVVWTKLRWTIQKQTNRPTIRSAINYPGLSGPPNLHKKITIGKPAGELQMHLDLIYQKTVIRVQKSIHSEVSLNVLGSFEAGVRQLCMEPIL
jgi:hypothetical protein